MKEKNGDNEADLGKTAREVEAVETLLLKPRQKKKKQRDTCIHTQGWNYSGKAGSSKREKKHIKSCLVRESCGSSIKAGAEKTLKAHFSTTTLETFSDVV